MLLNIFLPFMTNPNFVLYVSEVLGMCLSEAERSTAESYERFKANLQGMNPDERRFCRESIRSAQYQAAKILSPSEALVGLTDDAQLIAILS